MLCRFCLPIILVAACTTWNSLVVRCDIVLRRNAYTGITVALSPQIPPERLPDGFARTIAELVESASRKVYQYLNGRAFFDEVTLLVPSSLNASALVDKSSGTDLEVTVSSRPSFGSAHFVIVPDEGSVFGEHPYTLQYGPCGVPGLRTVLPFSYAAKVDGAAMAEEWYRLRYGVFSEEPVPNDPLYSPEVAVSKQRVLCDGKSAWDVIFSSNDFSDVIGQEYSYKRVKLNVVQEAPLRIVVVWNVESKEPATSTPYAPTLKALKKLAQALVPEDAMMALVAYSTDMFYADSELISMRTKSDREQFAKSYPRSQSDPSSLERAVAKALQLLDSQADGGSGSQGTILLVTHEAISQKDVSTAAAKLAKAQVRIHALLLSRSDAANSVEQLCLDNDGNVFLAEASENEALFFTHQANAMADLVFSKTSYAEISAPMMIKQRIIEPVNRGQEVSEVFYVDSQAGVTLRMDMVYKNEDTGSDYINYVSLSSPTGKIYDARSKELTPQSFNVQQFKIEDASPGQWTLRVKPSYGPLDSAMLEVWLGPTSITGPLISLRAWLSTSFTSVDPSKPFLVYAEVRKGSKPIRYVRVTATVIDPEGTPVEFNLVDNGAGDPDITAGDGIYSRYFTGFSKKGHYKLSVTAEGTNESVIVNGAAMDGGSPSPPPRCCGSQFPDSALVPTEPFSRYFEYGSFFSIQDRPEGDVYPPSRVTDLKATEIDLVMRRVTLEWTAPGNDYDQGTAKEYDIRYFDRAVDFALLFDTSGKKIDPFSIDGLAYSPKPFGEREKASFNLNCGDSGGSCYLAIRANDDSNNGPVSNAVEVKFPTPEPTVSPGGGGDPDGNGTGSELDNDRNYVRGGLTSLQLAVAIVLPLLFLLILIIVILLYVCFRRRGEKSKGSKDSSPPPPTRSRPIISAPIVQNGSPPKQKDDDGTDESGDKVNPYATSMYYGINPVNSYSADYLMDVYEDEKAKKGRRTPTAPDKADVSSETPSVDVPPEHQGWTSPEGRNDHNDVGLPSVRPYVTELRPTRSPPYNTESRVLPPGFSTEPRRQTFV
ncbi:hypothetical protein V5799_015507 [Amblyomma americanum]|uniref:VWFA domain-containing protein n=1 Tax=Amblyomma americanum TaxID=6943 RepID=A0AAQ4F7J8_AMBAM